MARPKPNQITKSKNIMGKTKAVIRTGDTTPFNMQRKIQRDQYIDQCCRLDRELDYLYRAYRPIM